jgi:Kef-type K+ transport system membrane component KefB
MLILLIIVMTAAMLAELIHLESIVGAFMAGLAVNRCLRGTKTHEHIEVLGKTLFVPAFFLSIGLSLDLPKIWESLIHHFWFVALLSAGLIAAKFAAAWVTGAVFKYKRDEWLNMWSLSMPQVAATIAAALVAFNSLDANNNRLIDQNVLSGVLVMVVITAIGGPILTEIFSKRIKGECAVRDEAKENA